MTESSRPVDERGDNIPDSESKAVCSLELCQVGRPKKTHFGARIAHIVPESVPENLVLLGKCTRNPQNEFGFAKIPSLKIRVQSDQKWAYRSTHPFDGCSVPVTG